MKHLSVVFAFFLAFYSKLSFSFSVYQKKVSNAFSKILVLRSTKYEQMLEQARQRKQQPQQTQVQQQQTRQQQPPQLREPKLEQVKQKEAVTQPITKPQRSKNSSGLPFNDEMYSHFKFVIEKITGKLRSDISLNSEELKLFKKSIDAIIADAYGEEMEQPTQASSNVETKPSSSSASGSPDVFAAFKGMRSTWEVKGADKMTTEEYYKAVNARILEVKNLRKSLGEDTTTDSYLKSLSKPKQ